MIVAPNFEALGLDDRRIDLIVQRWEHLDRSLSPWFATDSPWYVALCYKAFKQHRQELLADLEAAIVRTCVSNSTITVQSPHDILKQTLISLAHDLGFRDAAERGLILNCLGKGWFNQSRRQLSERYRPSLDDVLPRIFASRITPSTATIYSHNTECSD